MFRPEKYDNQTVISDLQRKKQLFQVRIRHQEKSRIINQLREVALIPEDIIKCINSLPATIQDVVSILVDNKNWSQRWHRTVASKLLPFFNTQLKNIDRKNVEPRHIVAMGSYVMLYCEIQQQKFDQVWAILKQLSINWKISQKQSLLRLLIKAITNYQDKKYFFQAKEVLRNQSKRFTPQALDFYNFIVKNCTDEAFSEQILNDHLCWRLAQALGFIFYSNDQKIKMCQILIQVLYQSKQQNVSKSWNLSALFQALQFLLRFANDQKLLAERCLFLIYNVNIDAGSKIFLIHSCVEVVVNQMKNRDIPLKLRELMAETYLSAISNLQPGCRPKYIKNHSKIFFSSLLFILKEFSQNKLLIRSSKSIMEVLNQLQEIVQDFDFKQMVNNNRQLVDAINSVSFDLELSQESLLQ